MPRRSHTKSRHGCLVCKARHLKCDETRPQCLNCTEGKRVCKYALLPTFRILTGPDNHQQRNRHRQRQRQQEVSTASLSPGPVGGAPRVPQEEEEPLSMMHGGGGGGSEHLPVNMLHVKLFHHFMAETIESIDANANMSKYQLTKVLDQATAAPYLMNEVLAVAALHLSVSVEHADQQSYYKTVADHLQTHAISSFNRCINNPMTAVVDTIAENNCVPMLMFSSLLGLHMLCTTLRYRRETVNNNNNNNNNNGFDEFWLRFMEYIRVHRGTLSVAGALWDSLSASPIKPALDAGEAFVTSSSSTGGGHDYNELRQRITSANNLPTSTVKMYLDTIRALQIVTDSVNKKTAVYDNAVVIWPLLVPKEYIESLELQRPEALVILAHYAVIIHRCSEMWVFGDDGGLFLIRCIRYYLGPDWDDWLELPEGIQENLMGTAL